MNEEFVSRHEHEAFEKRMDEANERQSKRISILEGEVKELRNISTSIQALAVEMKGMREEQARQGERLETLESQDGEKWREAVKYIATLLIGAVVGFALKQIGL